MIRNLSAKADYDDIMAEIYFKQKIDKSLKQIEKDKTVSHEEAKRRISKWIR